MSRTGRVILIGAVTVGAVVVAGAVVWAVALRDTANPASVEDAVARYREAASEGETAIPTGVYVYATTGEESISALGGATHKYPVESTITVVEADCGMELRWDVLEERSSLHRVCAEGDAQALAQWTERHRFFGQDDSNEWVCEDVPWLPTEREPGTELPYRCESEDTLQEGTLVVVGNETVTVGAIEVDAVRIKVEAKETGAATGTLVEERWLESETGLPLRVFYEVETKNPSPIGDVSFDESYDLLLTSLEPRT